MIVPGMFVCSSFLISVCMFIVSKALLISSATVIVRAGGAIWLNPFATVLFRTWLSHTFLFVKWEPSPECVTCCCRPTICHIVVDCIEYDFTDIFNNVSPNKIISFIKRAGVYNTL